MAGPEGTVGGQQDSPDGRRPEAELEQRVSALELRLEEAADLAEAVEDLRRKMASAGELLRSVSWVRNDDDETGEQPPAR